MSSNALESPDGQQSKDLLQSGHSSQSLIYSLMAKYSNAQIGASYRQVKWPPSHGTGGMGGGGQFYLRTAGVRVLQA